jgi:hypothetical protein
VNITKKATLQVNHIISHHIAHHLQVTTHHHTIIILPIARGHPAPTIEIINSLTIGALIDTLIKALIITTTLRMITLTKEINEKINPMSIAIDTTRVTAVMGVAMTISPHRGNLIARIANNLPLKLMTAPINNNLQESTRTKNNDPGPEISSIISLIKTITIIHHTINPTIRILSPMITSHHNIRRNHINNMTIIGTKNNPKC